MIEGFDCGWLVKIFSGLVANCSAIKNARRPIEGFGKGWNPSSSLAQRVLRMTFTCCPGGNDTISFPERSEALRLTSSTSTWILPAAGKSPSAIEIPTLTPTCLPQGRDLPCRSIFLRLPMNTILAFEIACTVLKPVTIAIASLNSKGSSCGITGCGTYVKGALSNGATPKYPARWPKTVHDCPKMVLWIQKDAPGSDQSSGQISSIYGTYYIVSWDDEIPNNYMEKHVPKHQPDYNISKCLIPASFLKHLMTPIGTMTHPASPVGNAANPPFYARCDAPGTLALAQT